MNEKIEKEAKHTELPWFQSGHTIQIENRFIALVGAEPRNEEDAANAAFIVRACNNHAELLGACQNAVVSLSIMRLPRLDENVATDRQIVDVAIAGLRAAIAEAEA